MKTKKVYIYNALLLTAVTLLMRTVSVSFNIYVSGKVGAEAMGLLSLVSGVYGFALTLATSGIHLATVRTVSERLATTHGAENRHCLVACLSYAAFFGTLSSLGLFLLARPIGLNLLSDGRTVRALRMMSLTLLPISLCSVLNGYFTAVRRAWKNALAQVAEQAIKIMLTGYLLVIAAPKTTEGCLLAVLLGGAVSESFSLALNTVLYFFDKRHFKGIKPDKRSRKIQVAKIAMPVAISAYMRSGLLTIEHILIPRGLKRFGAGNSAALAAYGSLQSMALPVVLYPAAILSSFASLLIPEMTEEQSKKNTREIRYIASRVYQMSLLFSVGVAGIMLFFSSGLGEVLYDSSEVAVYIRRLAPLIPIMYTDTATDAMLKGLGEQVYSMNVNILDAFVSVLSVWIFVPRIGISGYILTIYITEILNAALSLTRLLRITGFRPKLLQILVCPTGAIIGATALFRLSSRFMDLTICTGRTLTLSILAVALLYIGFLVCSQTFKKSDISWILGIFIPNQMLRRKKRGKKIVNKM